MSHKAHASRNLTPNISRPSHAACAKTLLDLQNQGTLSTHSSHHSQYPFGSMMPYALDQTGCPIFLISSMAMHTQNILQNKHASLYVAQSISDGEPLGTARVTLLGDIHHTTDEHIRHCYLKAHPNAHHWVDYEDFSFYRLDVKQLYFVGGFGIMGWINHTVYQEAMPDPLRHTATHAIQHMNDAHADALILLAKVHEGSDADSVRIIHLDCLGFDIKIIQNDHIHSARIAFKHAIENPEQIRSAFVKMVQDARKAL